MSEQKNLCRKVASGDIEVKKIYESSNIMAFHHPYPQYEKHVVIMPKNYIKDFTALKTEDELAVWDTIKVAKYVAKGLIKAGYGVRFFTNMGKFQEDDYLHFHLIAGEKIENNIVFD